MIDPREIAKIAGECQKEATRFLSFLVNHEEKHLDFGGKAVPYLAAGSGSKTLLTFAGGWGGVELAYDFVLALKDRHRVIVVDISAFEDPEEMGSGINLVLDREGVGRAVVFGQSFSGIIAQAYFRRHFARTSGLILANTLAPRPERSKVWALTLMKVLPLGLMKIAARKKMSRLSEFKRPIPADVQERRKFASKLLVRMIDTYWTRAKLLNVLKLAFAFNKEGFPPEGALAGWQGKILIVTSDDEPYFPDAGLLMNGLPGTEMFKLPVGFGHTAPQIHREEFHEIIRDFIVHLD